MLKTVSVPIVSLFLCITGLFPFETRADWEKLSTTNQFNDVAYTKEAHDELVSATNSADFWGVIGPKAVFLAWNSSAFDAANNKIYFFGGGHTDYGGNEVYQFDVEQKSWARLTDPAPLVIAEPHAELPEHSVYLPESTPLVPHTYDGMLWNPATQSLWFISTSGYGGVNLPPHKPSVPKLWEFSPRTKTWKSYTIDHHFPYPMSGVRKNGDMLFLSNQSGSKGMLVKPDGRQQYFTTVTGLGGASNIGSVFVHPETGQFYSSHDQGIYQLDVIGNNLQATKLASYPPLEELHFTMDFRQAAFNYRPTDSKFYIWNGGPEVVTWSPQTKRFEVIWNENQANTPSRSGQGANRVFEKFVYLEQDDLFVGLQNAEDGLGSDGVWTWVPNANPEDLNTIKPGELEIDGTTATSVSFLLPIMAGDKNFNASASLWLKKTSEEEWQRSLDLFRIRPELVRNTKNNTGLSPSAFAGIVTGLHPATDYQFKVSLTDPDGYTKDLFSQASTSSPVDVQAPPTGRTVPVASATALNQAIQNLRPGDTVELAPGIYNTKLLIKVSGTPDKPITIKGSVGQLATIDAGGQGSALSINANHIHIRDLSIQNADTGVRLLGSTEDVLITGTRIANISIGINAKGGHRTLRIHNNVLEGRAEIGDTSSSTWNYEGIVVTGQDIEVSNNTLSGFGDALGMSWQSSIPNKSINMHHNKVLWSGDDGIEFDFSLRNVSVHHNLLANLANGLSFQPVWGGPVYAHHNMVINAGRGPLKIKPEQDSPAGMMIYHNTFIRSDSEIKYGGTYAWVNNSGQIRLLDIRNNLFVSSGNGDTVLRNDSKHALTIMDYNAWTADGKFAFNIESLPWAVSEPNFAEWKNSALGNNDVLVSLDKLFSQYDSKVVDQPFSEFRDVENISLQLHQESQAAWQGLIIPGISSSSSTTTHMGAIEPGQSMPQTGANLNQVPFSGVYAAPDFIQVEVNKSRSFDPVQNDVHPADQPFQTQIVGTTSSEFGQLQAQSDGTLVFTSQGGQLGSSEFQYQLSSGNESSAAHIYIQVVPTNQAPQANADQVEAKDGETTVFSAYDLLANDTDQDGDELRVVAISSVEFGAATLLDNEIQYTPKENSPTRDSFIYTIEDTKGATASAKVTINVISGGTIVGTSQRDFIDLSGRTDSYVILGKGGPDIITGSSGDDVIVGGAHEDQMWGGPGNDTFLYHDTDHAKDWIHGGDGFDIILGDEHDNVINAYEITGIERIDGGDGYDVIRGDNSRVIWDFSDVQLLSIELIDGARGHDIITGSAGNDIIRGGPGSDKIDGWRGFDIVLYDGKFSDYRIDFTNDTIIVTALVSDEGVDTLRHVEQLRFSDKTFRVRN